jgi:hypothetical protein
MRGTLRPVMTSVNGALAPGGNVSDLR